MDAPRQERDVASAEDDWVPRKSAAIEDHGVIGDLRTCALVSTDGTLDWLCYPHFDSPAVFAHLLDPVKGGLYRIAPEQRGHVRKQFYWPETNVLVTRFLSEEGVGELYDFMVLDAELKQQRRVVRAVRVVRGSMSFRLHCEPACDFARDPHRAERIPGGVRFKCESLCLALASQVPLKVEGRAAVARFSLEAGEVAVFSLEESDRDTCHASAFDKAKGEAMFQETVAYWRHWVGGCTYTGRWREVVHRSALALKLLTFEPTGAIVAAPTCSLPEAMGGKRNWDYRYTWIRDAAFTVYGLLRIGFTREAGRFMGWLEERCKELGPDGSLQIMYGLDGRHVLDEEHLTHLSGHKGSAPVRVGNDAYKQLQLDIYGELMDSVYLYNKHGVPISYDLWRHLRRLVNWVCDHWREQDDGIWEVRGGRKHFVYSKVMCWVALDRALRLADKRSFPADRRRWLEVRDQIYEEVLELGWSEERGAFLQAYGVDSLDAANLIMPLVFFISPGDPRLLKTLEATLRMPKDGGLVSDSLVYRYDLDRTPDGLEGVEGTFNLCTFWLVEAMTRAGVAERKYLGHARLMFERMLGYANHLGLYAEQIGPSGEALGNFPQALTHLSLISAAFNLDRALGHRD
ncbi:glycoside hydrolase family 15 protein [Aggregicoccus sp. 17bor-14]|uniref:glycoside hydrolase family 15 protein n=1 Tax=Myxococcaceae TaxID=31 RepID=UPI00129CB3E3|nr:MULTISPECIES: glycoside hydrolase family 15 protein [Myxococcaceae]MBF5045477.1 glycoside hydrolase family 15 protein [Simulacricoccus sp. 17bor-14]MRI91215.1 glycoside hydrolase family 15 protein [Aggregicoccus sp. 17bor-14]